MADKPRVVPIDDDQMFECGCGRMIASDKWTECKKCGAHHVMGDDPRGVMIQAAPPQGGMDAWKDGEWVGE